MPMVLALSVRSSETTNHPLSDVMTFFPNSLKVAYTPHTLRLFVALSGLPGVISSVYRTMFQGTLTDDGFFLSASTNTFFKGSERRRYQINAGTLQASMCCLLPSLSTTSSLRNTFPCGVSTLTASSLFLFKDELDPAS